jgi:hypothetical protein
VASVGRNDFDAGQGEGVARLTLGFVQVAPLHAVWPHDAGQAQARIVQIAKAAASRIDMAE